MSVGEAISTLIDSPDKRMTFKVPEMSTSEANWYKSIICVHDVVGLRDAIKSGSLVPGTRVKVPARKHTAPKPQSIRGNDLHGSSKIVAIQELDDDGEENEDDDLIPYEKPDDDEEDSDDDPTLVVRNKPTAPVYIRDLITYLRDTEDYDRQRLALNTAPSLIRRKANFGTEVGAHVEDLAALLVGLQDKYELDNFQDVRIQGMIAIVIAKPLEMGQWFAKTFFDGDYSISQRAAILSTLSLSARELGGYKDEDGSLTSMAPLPSTSFPSKTLPAKLNSTFAGSLPSPVDALARRLERTMIAPLAAHAADELSGPNILKVRTFSSRLAVESRRTKPIANALAKVVADGFFFPLTARWWLHMKAYGAENVVFSPFLLSSYLKTLSLIIHASGSSTLSLPQMTREFWDLLLTLRGGGQGDKSVVEALLFAFLTLLEVNEDKRRLAEDHARELLETQEWVNGLFNNLGGGSAEDEKIRMLAAGVLIRTREVVEKYQTLLMGDMVSF